MKFGSQLKFNSVPEWRNYNIDYNDIKRRIKLVTSIKNPSQHDELLEDLHDSLVEQIDTVNLFIQSKVGEVQRRIVHLESLLEQDEVTQHYDIEQQVSALSSDAQKLSRFLMLQKTALRKLLKKYTKYSKDGGELNTIINKYVMNSPNSFIHVDLSGLYLEIALIYDIVREKSVLTTGNTPIQSPMKNSRRRSSLINPIEYLNKEEMFDFENIQKSTQTLKFFVHYDNLNELKLFLLQNFYLIDQTVNQQKKYLQMARKTSSLSIRELIEHQKSKLTTVPEEPETESETHTEDSENNDIYKSNSIYLNNSDGLTFDERWTQLIFDDPKSFNSIKNNTDPTILLTKNCKQEFRSMLISAIGGLRKNSNILFHQKEILDELLESCLRGDSYEDFQAVNETFFETLDSLEKVSIEFIFKKHFKPLIKTNVTKSRFSNTQKPINSNDFKCWISLQSNINISKSELSDSAWTAENDADAELFPYAYLQIRHNSPSTGDLASFPQPLQDLINSHLVYEINDEDTFTTLTYSLYKSGKLPFTPTWADLFDEDKDIRKLPPKVRRERKKKSVEEHQGSTSGESTDQQPKQQLRYWNEFDNGSDFEGNDDGFFIPLEDDDDSNMKLLFFSNDTIDKFYEMSYELSKILHEKLPLIFEPLGSEDCNDLETGLLRNDYDTNYGAVDATDQSITSNSSNSSLLNNWHNSRQAHDKFLIFLALLTSLLSLLLTAMSLGVSLSLMSIGDVIINEYVIFVLVLALLTSLFFTVLSMCLYMMSESENRTYFQSLFIWSNFVLVNLMIIGGLVSAFGI